ncbi:MAG: hypothetical protein V3R76_05130, partial [Gammaproteobacteria bacterium]
QFIYRGSIYRLAKKPENENKYRDQIQFTSHASSPFKRAIESVDAKFVQHFAFSRLVRLDSDRY